MKFKLSNLSTESTQEFDFIGTQSKEALLETQNLLSPRESSHQKLKPLYLLIGFLVIICSLVSLFCLAINNYMIQKHKRHESPHYFHENEFKWESKCGETFYKPRFQPHSLMKRIIGGTDAVKHSWPFLVSIRVNLDNKSEHHCGGTLVSPTHVLTAAHCIFPFLKMASSLNLNMTEMLNLIRVQVGINEHNAFTGVMSNEELHENIYRVKFFDFHDEFNFDDTTLTNDIAIFELARPVNLNRPEVNFLFFWRL